METKLHDTTVNLEKLYDAYNSILTEAKTQLERMELSPTQVDDVSTRVSNSSTFTKRVSDRLMVILRETFCESNEEELLEDEVVSRFIDALAVKVYARIKDNIDRQVERLLKEKLDSAYFDTLVKTKMAEHGDISTAFAAMDTLSGLFEYMLKASKQDPGWPQPEAKESEGSETESTSPEVPSKRGEKAYRQAISMGLKYAGFGYWNDPETGLKAYKTINDELVKIEPEENNSGS